MAKRLPSYLSPAVTYFDSFKSYINNKNLVIDFVSKLTITLGVVLIVGGLYLMLVSPSKSSLTSQANVAAQSVIQTAKWIPGLPFNIADLAGCTISAIGLVLWLMGINLLLTGLGLWVRHRLARLIAIGIFSVAAFLQFIQFLLYGIVGASPSLVMLGADLIMTYLLFSAG
jgi:hypothetical protein